MPYVSVKRQVGCGDKPHQLVIIITAKGAFSHNNHPSCLTEDDSMTKFFQFSALILAMGSTSVFAHHPAADIVDEDIYAMIDENVSDTPHATMTFDEMGGGMTETTVTTATVDDLETLIEEQDLLEYVERLDGVVDVSIQFNVDRSVTMTINQVR